VVDVAEEEEEGGEDNAKTGLMSLDMITLNWVRLIPPFVL